MEIYPISNIKEGYKLINPNQRENFKILKLNFIFNLSDQLNIDKLCNFNIIYSATLKKDYQIFNLTFKAEKNKDIWSIQNEKKLSLEEYSWDGTLTLLEQGINLLPSDVYKSKIKYISIYKKENLFCSFSDEINCEISNIILE